MVENITLIQELTNQVSTLSTFLQAIGGIILFYIVFSIVNAVLNRKKQNQLKKMNNTLEEIRDLLKKEKRSKK